MRKYIFEWSLTLLILEETKKSMPKKQKSKALNKSMLYL